jgi:coenzyme PQQ precursor peptide PqqA
MTESVQQAVEQHAQHAQPESEEAGAWQTPDYTVVDTALEVTAYSLSSR